MDLVLQLRGKRGPCSRTPLGWIICHQWIPEKTLYLAAVCLASSERYLWAWVYLLSHSVAALIRDSEPHETVCWTWQRGILCLCLLFWTHGEWLSLLTGCLCCQTHKLHTKSLQTGCRGRTRPRSERSTGELSSPLILWAGASAASLSSHVSNEFPIKLAIWPSRVLFSLFSFDYTQAIFFPPLKAGD